MYVCTYGSEVQNQTHAFFRPVPLRQQREFITGVSCYHITLPRPSATDVLLKQALQKLQMVTGWEASTKRKEGEHFILKHNIRGFICSHSNFNPACPKRTQNETASIRRLTG